MLQKKTYVVLFLSLLVIFPVFQAAAASGTIAEITVKPGETGRVDCPVCVDLPESVNPYRPLRLLEETGGKEVPVPMQVMQCKPKKLCWILDGKTASGSVRKYKLVYGPPFQSKKVRMKLTSKTLDVSFDGAPLFSYNHGHVLPPEGISMRYIRSGYISPMFSPSGMQITEDFPSDHHHHKGIWFPWTNTEFQGHHVDFWNLGKGQGTVQYAGFDLIGNGPVFGRFKARHEHLDITESKKGTVVLDETWDVRIWAVGGRESGYWLWDLISTQKCVASSPLHLNAYRYGGLGFRGAKQWKGDNYKVLSSEGKTKKNGHRTRSKWCAHSGAIKENWSTVVLMCHPDNERFPEPMRIWARGGAFFNYCPIQQKPMDLKPGEKHVFKYRFFVHEGKIDSKRAERRWKGFAHPPQVELELKR